MPLLFDRHGNTSILQMKILLQLLDELLPSPPAMTYLRPNSRTIGAIWSVVGVSIDIIATTSELNHLQLSLPHLSTRATGTPSSMIITP